MTDSRALREIIKSKGLKLGYLAKQLGITSYTLSMKIDNLKQFKAKEIQTLCEILCLSEEEMIKIFFAKKVDL